MTPEEITTGLNRIAMKDDFAAHSDQLVSLWSTANVGLNGVETILRFIEKHPQLDYGAPGPLVHFVERYYGKGYEEKLVESIRRKPTALTAWMLNRVINGTKDIKGKTALIKIMEDAKSNPLADADFIQQAERFLRRLS